MYLCINLGFMLAICIQIDGFVLLKGSGSTKTVHRDAVNIDRDGCHAEETRLNYIFTPVRSICLYVSRCINI